MFELKFFLKIYILKQKKTAPNSNIHGTIISVYIKKTTKQKIKFKFRIWFIKLIKPIIKYFYLHIYNLDLENNINRYYLVI